MEFNVTLMSSNLRLRDTAVADRLEWTACRPFKACLSEKPRVFRFFLATLVLGVSGCSQPASKPSSGGSNASALFGEGDEVILDRTSRELTSGLPPAKSTSTQGANQQGRWSIVLETVAGDAHQLHAKSTLQAITQRYPELRNAFVQATDRGSAVWIGHFDAPTTPAAKAALKRVQAMTNQRQPAFPRAFLSVLPDTSPVRELDLRRARILFPNVNPLYTLQIAAWGTFGSSEISWASVQADAERYAAQLRRRGHQAFYYHDAVTELSVVTIGVFDRRAYDAQSTLFSPEVELLRRKFPRHLINGEAVEVELKPGDPRSRVPQECRLVVVPELP